MGLAETFATSAPDGPPGGPVPAAPSARRVRSAPPSDGALVTALMEAHPRLLAAARVVPVGAAPTGGLPVVGAEAPPRVRAEGPGRTEPAT